MTFCVFGGTCLDSILAPFAGLSDAWYDMTLLAFRPKVVSPGSPNYLYDSCLRTDDISFRESKPYVGVMKDSSGYLLCQVNQLLYLVAVGRCFDFTFA